MTIKAGIVGGTGYTGVELLRLLAQHPQVELKAITSRKEAGTPVAQMFPSLRRRGEDWPRGGDVSGCGSGDWHCGDVGFDRDSRDGS